MELSTSPIERANRSRGASREKNPFDAHYSTAQSKQIANPKKVFACEKNISRSDLGLSTSP
jgi:hypothetical protein